MNFLTKWEKETGWVAIKDTKLPDFKTADEFREHVGNNPNDFLHVQLDVREAFLKANDYPINRKSLLNIDLSDQITDEPEPAESLVDALMQAEGQPGAVPKPRQ